MIERMLNVRFILETITPQLAEQMLKCNALNRNLSKRTVEAYASDMKAGRWYLNGEPIVFNDEGILVNGQHILSAVVLANMSVQFAVVRGVTKEDSQVYDVGKNRDVSDLLKFIGETTLANKMLAAVGLSVMKYAVGDHRSTKEARIDFILENRKVFEWFMTAIYKECGKSSSKGSSIHVPAPVGAAICCAYRFGCDEMLLRDFLRVFKTGVPQSEREQTIVAFRNYYVLKPTSKKGETFQKDLFLRAQRSIFNYVTGKKVMVCHASNIVYYPWITEEEGD